MAGRNRRQEDGMGEEVGAAPRFIRTTQRIRTRGGIGESSPPPPLLENRGLILGPTALHLQPDPYRSEDYPLASIRIAAVDNLWTPRGVHRQAGRHLFARTRTRREAGAVHY